MIRLVSLAAAGFVLLNLSGAVQPGWSRGLSLQAWPGGMPSSLQGALSARSALLEALTLPPEPVRRR